jgi:adenylate cyclase
MRAANESATSGSLIARRLPADSESGDREVVHVAIGSAENDSIPLTQLAGGHRRIPECTDPGLLRGEVREVSVVMADLRGFTAFCERVPPVRMSAVLNEYLTAMIDAILENNGRVQDFVGDGVLGVFGAPGPDPDHAWHAVLSALALVRAVRHLRTRWDGEAFGLGVAVHTGQAFAGAVGSSRQSKYAVVGDPVNTVARLEDLNRVLGTEILMTGEVLAATRDRVDVDSRGSFSVRGKNQTLEVFELLGLPDVPACPPRAHLARAA